jgi:histidinol-phosphate aminotransferase
LSEQLAEVGQAKAVRLDMNELPFGPPPRAVARIREQAGLIHLYPAPLDLRVTEAVATYLGLDPDGVLLTRGIDEAADLCLLEFGHAHYLRPGFSGFRDRAAALDVSAQEWQLVGEEFELPDQIYDDLGGGDLLMLADPNNPTGTYFGRAVIERLLATGARVLLDRTYLDFSEEAVSEEFGTSENLIVFHSFSKSFGLAGVRLGCLSGDPAVISVLRARQQFLSVDHLSLSALLGALEEEPEYARAMARSLLPVRAELVRVLRGSGAFRRVWDSHANFVLGTCATATEAVELREMLRDRAGVSVAGTASFGLPEGIRVSVGSRWAHERLALGLGQWMEDTSQRFEEAKG